MQKRLLILGAAVAIVALACGGSDAADEPQQVPPTTVVSDGTPLASGACVEGTVDCQDTLVGDEPLFVGDEPRDGVAPGAGDQDLVAAPLTVSDALAVDADGPLSVQGFIVTSGDDARLCELLAESMPPQCGGASITVADLGVVDPDELSSSQGVTWSDQPVTILGQVIDGILVPTFGS